MSKNWLHNYKTDFMAILTVVVRPVYRLIAVDKVPARFRSIVLSVDKYFTAKAVLISDVRRLLPKKACSKTVESNCF